MASTLPSPSDCCTLCDGLTVEIVEEADGACCNIIENTFTDTPPADTTKVWFATYRDGSPSRTWDPATQAWI